MVKESGVKICAKSNMQIQLLLKIHATEARILLFSPVKPKPGTVK